MEDFLTKLPTDSVWATIFIATIVWFMKTVVQPLTARQIAFMDKMDERDDAKTLHLAAIDANITEMRQRQAEHIEVCRSGTHTKLQHKPA